MRKIHESKLETEKVLAQHLNRLDLDLRQTVLRKESLEQANNDLLVKLNELNLDQDSFDKSNAKSQSQKESVFVQLNMLRLQVEKLNEQVASKSDELTSSKQKAATPFVDGGANTRDQQPFGCAENAAKNGGRGAA